MTVDKIKERYLSIIVAIIVGLLNYMTLISYKINMPSFMDKAITFSSISFGFLLTVLSLLIQTDTPAINRIKESGRFDDLINFNKKAVIASALLVFCALIYLGFQLNIDTCLDLFGRSLPIRKFADTIAISIFLYQAVEVYLFLDLFYFIIKQKE